MKIKRLNDFARRVRHLPGSIDRLQETVDEQQKTSDDYRKKLEDLIGTNRTLFKVYEDQRAEAEIQNTRLRSLDIRVSDLLHQISSLEKLASQPKKSPNGAGAKQASPTLQADDHILDNFYVLFENHFRGSETDIKQRQKTYLNYFTNSPIDSKKHPILDIGCGRGEFIELLDKHNFRGIGLDLNEAMVGMLNEKGLEGVRADALSYLSQQPSDSLMAITGFHIIEHIPFPVLLRIFAECYRVLAPGGFVIFETPNPENTLVGSCNFYIDPSHLHPLPPAVTEFALSTRGFTETEILRIHPVQEKISHADPAVKKLLEYFLGPQDYAVIATKS